MFHIIVATSFFYCLGAFSFFIPPMGVAWAKGGRLTPPPPIIPLLTEGWSSAISEDGQCDQRRKITRVMISRRSASK